MVAMELDILHETAPLMISNADEDGEPWHLARWFGNSRPPLAFIHYCQKYTVGQQSWGKHEYHGLGMVRLYVLNVDGSINYWFRTIDIRKCDQRQFFPGLTQQDRDLFASLQWTPLAGGPGVDRGRLVKARSAWLYHEVVNSVQMALQAWVEDHCPTPT